MGTYYMSGTIIGGVFISVNKINVRRKILSLYHCSIMRIHRQYYNTKDSIIYAYDYCGKN